jgi:hypothetical protein
MIEAFDLRVSDETLDDLRHRLANTRWPDAETVDDASQGPRLEKLRALGAYWQEGYDWRECEALLNDFGQYRTAIDGLSIHFLHIRSVEPNAVPLLMCHGWPGSILEFRKLIGPLTNPRAHSADPKIAFDVIAPPMPGFAFSDKPKQPGRDLDRIADAYIALMTRLGYERWGMQGGDLGCAVVDVERPERGAPPRPASSSLWPCCCACAGR